MFFLETSTMKFNKSFLLIILLLSSIPFMAQARFSLKHELSKDQANKQDNNKKTELNKQKPNTQANTKKSTHTKSADLSNNQLNNKCRIHNPRINCWARFANKKGNAHAQYMLGKFFYNGTGINRNRRKALTYFKMASYNNSGSAQIMLAKMFQRGQGGLQRNNAHALAWYIVAVRKHGYNHSFVEKVKHLRRNLSYHMSRRSLRKAKRLANRLEDQIR